VRGLLLGILPVIGFTVVENYYGPLAGTIAGMVLGLVEIIWEKRTQGRVTGLTLGMNAFVLILGGVSIATQDGVWFKLQPALFELIFGIGLLAAWFLRKPILFSMTEAALTKQGKSLDPQVREKLQSAFSPIMFRLGLFMLAHAALATWAALKWTTEAWALLKGVGFTGSVVVFMLVEMRGVRQSLARE
jgi:intracellular septation protein